MTIGITGPGRKAPRQNALVRLIVAAFVGGICLILLGLTSDFLVDWLWFSSIGYLPVFLTSIGAKALVFFAVLTATAVILWLNGLLAVRFARQQPIQAFAASAWNPTGSRLFACHRRVSIYSPLSLRLRENLVAGRFPEYVFQTRRR